MSGSTDFKARIDDLVEEFLDRVERVPPIEVVLKAGSRTVMYKHLRSAPSFRAEGKMLGSGWYVTTPRAPEVLTHRSTGRDETETYQRPGIAVITDGTLYSCYPSHQQLLALTELRSTAALAVHTHGSSGPTSEHVVQELERLLAAAATSPWQPPPRLTRRDVRRMRKESRRYLEEQTFGPGGLKAYRERTYGPQGPVGRLRERGRKIRAWFS